MDTMSVCLSICMFLFSDSLDFNEIGIWGCVLNVK